MKPSFPRRKSYNPDEDGNYAQFMKHMKIKDVVEDNFIGQIKTAISDLSGVVLARCKDANDTISVKVSIKYLRKPPHIKLQELEETVNDENLNEVVKMLNEALQQHLAKKKKLVKELHKKIKQIRKEKDAAATGDPEIESKDMPTEVPSKKSKKRSVSESVSTSYAEESPESKRKRCVSVTEGDEQTLASDVNSQKSKKQKKKHSLDSIEPEINKSQLDSSFGKQSKIKTPKNKQNKNNSDIDASNSSKKKKKQQV